ncbi:hypothetical protein QE152_g4201 [Popillia japonica]|uniref:Retrotransposon gag domain-containing protein n=1 Tax=Popillia japonica TaxID=7064 RepID=A0AAW1N364_POPJA
MQLEGEAIQNYVAELRKLINCNFNCPSCQASTIDTHIRAQFIRGIRDNDIRERLLQQKSTVSFEEIIQIAQSVEIAKQESNQMQPNNYNVHTLRENSNEAKSNQSRYKKSNFNKFVDTNKRNKVRSLWENVFVAGRKTWIIRPMNVTRRN